MVTRKQKTRGEGERMSKFVKPRKRFVEGGQQPAKRTQSGAGGGGERNGARANCSQQHDDFYKKKCANHQQDIAERVARYGASQSL